MNVNIPIINNKILNQFALDQREKSLAYLRRQFSLSDDDCQDIYQEAFISLYENVQTGKLKELTSSLTTYFIGICRFKAFEYIRSHGRSILVDDDLSLSIMNSEVQNSKIERLLSLDQDEEMVQEKKNALIRKIVGDLPHPCNELLWGFYRDNFSMSTLAKMFNYKNESSVKVTKHRCTEKFRIRYSELIKSFF